MLTLDDIRKRGSKCIPKDVTAFLIINSKPVAAIVPMEEYELSERMREDLEDMQAIEDRRGEPTLSMEEVFPPKKRR